MPHYRREPKTPKAAKESANDAKFSGKKIGCGNWHEILNEFRDKDELSPTLSQL